MRTDVFAGMIAKITGFCVKVGRGTVLLFTEVSEDFCEQNYAKKGALVSFL